MQNANSVDLHDYLQAAYVAAGFANATNANSVDLHDYLQAAYVAAGFANATNVNFPNSIVPAAPLPELAVEAVLYYPVPTHSALASNLQ